MVALKLQPFGQGEGSVEPGKHIFYDGWAATGNWAERIVILQAHNQEQVRRD